MTSEIPNVNKTGQYSIKQTCKALGISRSTLCRKTKDGYISARHRVGTLRPFYMGSEILRYWHSHCL